MAGAFCRDLSYKIEIIEFNFEVFLVYINISEIFE